MKHLYVSLLSVTSLLACSGAPQKPSTLMLNNTADAFQATMTQLIEHQMSTGDVPGLSIAVVNDQDVIWRQGFGTSNRGTQQLVTADTQFQAGSLTKIFTAVAVMQQIEQGKMQVDDSLATHIPEFSIHSRFGPTDTITLRNLMTHHSGLPGDYVSGMWMTQPSNVKPPSVDFKHYVKTLSHEYQSFPVHTIHAYSNIGYTLLGEAVTRTAQQDYASYINNAQLKPLAMDNSYVSHELCQPGVAIGYGGPNAASACTLRDIAAGGLITTVNDLTHFIKMLSNQGVLNDSRVIEPQSLDAMYEIQNQNVPLDFNFKQGLGWRYDYADILPGRHVVVSHGGNTLSHSSEFIYSPSAKMGVAVMANKRGSAEVPDIARTVMQLAYQLKFNTPVDSENDMVKSTYIPDTYSDIAGQYASSQFGLVTIIPKGDDYLFTSSNFPEKLDLVHTTDNKYHLAYDLWGFIPIDLDELKELEFSFEKIQGHKLLTSYVEPFRHKTIFGTKVSTSMLLSHWQQFLGEYKPLNPSQGDVSSIFSVTLSEKDGQLLVSAVTSPGEGTKSYGVLNPVDNQHAIGAGLGRGLGDTISLDTQQEQPILSYSGYQFIKM